MKTVKVNLTNEAISDRGLQITELCNFLNKDNFNDWQEVSDNEVVEYTENDSIYWSVSEATENEQGTYTLELDC